MEKSVLNQICTLYDSFFETEKKIGDYIIRNPKDIVDVTVGELAVKCQVSEASISRFCKKIGLKGFHHLKISIAKELVNREDNEEYSNDISIDNKKQSLKSIPVLRAPMHRRPGIDSAMRRAGRRDGEIVEENAFVSPCARELRYHTVRLRRGRAKKPRPGKEGTRCDHDAGRDPNAQAGCAVAG